MSSWATEGMTYIFFTICFYTSLVNVILSIVKLISLLFDDSIALYYGLISFLSEKSFADLEEKYRMPERLEINNIEKIDKLSALRPKALVETPFLKFDLDNLEKLDIRRLEIRVLKN